LSDAAVVGKDASRVLPLRERVTDMPLVALGIDVLWRLCPEHRMTGRVVADSGLMIGALLGTSSVSFEFCGPVVERVKGLVSAAPWGHAFVTQRLLRYSGQLGSSAAPVRVATPTGLTGEVGGDEWLPWRVGRMPLVLVTPVVRTMY
jgi:hypothetical protein